MNNNRQSYDDDNQEEYALQAAVEGSGYHKSKGLQWLDLCPHLGASEKTLLRVLLSLTRHENPRRKISPEELRYLVYSGSVPLGEEPKYASASGLRRMLRTLAALGQITTPEDRPLTFSSGKSAQSRAVTMQIWRYPRHECSSRNAYDALARVRKDEEKPPRHPLAGPDMAPRWQHLPVLAPTEGTPSDQVGQKDDQVGQKDDQVGQKDNQHSSGDQGKNALPFTAPSTAPCILPSPPAPHISGDPRGPQNTPSGREEDHFQEDQGMPSATSSEGPADDHADLQKAAEGLVDGAVRVWPSSAMAPNPRDRHRLVGRVMDELADGGDPQVIHHELTRDLNTAASVLRVIMGARTHTFGWGKRIDPRPDHAQYEISNPGHPWCGRCDERTRLIGVYDPTTGKTLPGRCRTPVVDHRGETVACNPRTTPSLPDDTSFDNEGQEEDLSPDEFAAMSKASLENPKASRSELLAAARAKMAEGSEKVKAGKGSR